MKKNADIWLGGFLTLLVLSIFGLMLYKLGMPDELNEVGDAVAGFSSTLAFVWLVLSVLAQRKEINEARDHQNQMLEHMEVEREIEDRRECVEQTKLYLESLNYIMEEVRDVVEHLASKTGVQMEGEISRKTAVVAARYLIVRYGNSIREEQERLQVLAHYLGSYMEIWNMLDTYLSENPHGPWVKTAFVDKSYYKNWSNVISNARSQPGLLGEIFGAQSD